MILVFDTETTGKADFRASAAAAHQPRLVQIAALLVNDNFRVVHSFSAIVYPTDWEIPEGAAAVHGITTETARRYGMEVGKVLAHFEDLLRFTTRRVAHNVEFDDLDVMGCLKVYRWLMEKQPEDNIPM
jgi:DNA polymerase-3 subunit epsilon